MDALILSAVCLLCAAQAPQAVEQWRPIIAEAAARFSIPQIWIAGVMQAESAGHTTLGGKPITSPAGAMGLMQLMPNTYNDLRRRYGFGADPYAVHDNILAGAAYLRAMYERYGYPNLFAAYNAGPRRLDELLLQGRPLPRMTVAYVETIVPGLSTAFGTPNRAQTEAASHAENLLFVTLTSTSSGPSAGRNSIVHDQQISSAPAMQTVSSAHDLFVPLSRTAP